MTYHLGLLTVDLYINTSPQSLKEKRMVIKPLKDKIRQTFNVSVSELDSQDKWQVATLGMVMIGPDHHYIDSCLQNLLKLIEGYHPVDITHHQIEYR